MMLINVSTCVFFYCLFIVIHQVSPFQASSFSSRSTITNQQHDSTTHSRTNDDGNALFRDGNQGVKEQSTSTQKKPFDVEEALQVVSSHRFEFPFWDPIQHNVMIQRVVDLSSDSLLSVAIDICNEYANGALAKIDSSAKYRCLVPTLLTLRFTKLYAIALIAGRYEYFPYDEEIYGLLAGYDELLDDYGLVGMRRATKQLLFKTEADGEMTTDSADFNKERGRRESGSQDGLTACIIGIPTAHTILPALFTNSVKRVLVFSRLHDFNDDQEYAIKQEDISAKRHQIGKKSMCNVHSDSELIRRNQTVWNYFHANEAAQLLDKTIQYMGMKQLISDVRKKISSIKGGKNGVHLGEAMEDIEIEVSAQDDEFNFREEVMSQCSVIQFNTGHECELSISHSNDDVRDQEGVDEFEERDIRGDLIRYLSLPPTNKVGDESSTRVIIMRWKSPGHAILQGNASLLLLSEKHHHKTQQFRYDKNALRNKSVNKVETIRKLERALSIDAYFTTNWLANNYFISRSPCTPSTTASFQLCTMYSGSRSVISSLPDGSKAGLFTIVLGKYNYHHDHSDTLLSNGRQHEVEQEKSNIKATAKKTVIVITNSLNTFTENVFGLASALQQIQRINSNDSSSIAIPAFEVYVAVEMNWHIYDYFLHVLHADRVIHIVLSALDLSLYARHAVIYNSEQPFFSAIFGHGLARYRSLFLDNDLMIWSFAQSTTQYLQQRVFQYPNISSNGDNADNIHSLVSHQEVLKQRIVPVPYMYSLSHKALLEKLFTVKDTEGNLITRINDTAAIHQHIPLFLHSQTPLSAYVNDQNQPWLSSQQIVSIHQHEISSQSQHRIVLYMGSGYTRRSVITAELERLFLQAHWQGTLDPMIKFYNLCDQFVYDYYRDYYLKKAQIVLNLASSWNNSVLETHRINYLLSLGKVIVSEMGSDESLSADYQSGIIFVNKTVVDDGTVEDETEDMMKEQALKIFEVITALMADEILLTEQSQRGEKFYHEVILKKSQQQLQHAMINTLNYFSE